jgi:hypothetical protein
MAKGSRGPKGAYGQYRSVKAWKKPSRVQRFVYWGAIKGLLSGCVLRQDENRGLKGDEVLRGGRGQPAFELKV